jgi:hypothetical protein
VSTIGKKQNIVCLRRSKRQRSALRILPELDNPLAIRQALREMQHQPLAVSRYRQRGVDGRTLIYDQHVVAPQQIRQLRETRVRHRVVTRV